MLVLSRGKDQVITIGDNIRITITDIRGDKVRVGIDAPTDVPVHRLEVYEQIQRERQREFERLWRQMECLKCGEKWWEPKRQAPRGCGDCGAAIGQVVFIEPERN